MQRLGPILCSDGQPPFAMQCLNDLDAEYQDKTYTPFNGGFHTMLELYKIRGTLFEPSHMHLIWKQWWTPDAQLN